jgi:bacteriorhodopsin
MKKIVNNFLGFVFALIIIPMMVLGSFELAKQYPTYNRVVCFSYLFVFLWNGYYVIRDWKKPKVK